MPQISKHKVKLEAPRKDFFMSKIEQPCSPVIETGWAHRLVGGHIISHYFVLHSQTLYLLQVEIGRGSG